MKRQKFWSILAIALLCLLPFHPAAAQDGATLKKILEELKEIKKTLKDMGNFLVDTTNQVVESTTNLIYELDPAIAVTIAGNDTYNENTDEVNAKTRRLTQEQVNDRIKQEIELHKLAFDVIAHDSYIPKDQTVSIWDIPQQNGKKFKACYQKYFQKTRDVTYEQLKNKGDTVFNYANFFEPLGYETPESQCFAKTYLQYLSTYSMDLEKEIREAKNKMKEVLKNADNKREAYESMREDKEFVEKMYDIRNTLASRSLALNNFYYLFTERQRIQGAGKKAGMKQDNASPLEIQHFLVNQRAGNPEWYKAMSQASPTTVDREMLFLLAEIRRQMFQQHLDNERIISSLSSIAIAVSGSV